MFHATSLIVRRTTLCSGFFLFLVASQGFADPLVPFSQTGALFVMESGSGSILGIRPDGIVFPLLTKAQIRQATGTFGTPGADFGFSQQSLAFDGMPVGVLFFSERECGCILRWFRGSLSVHVSEPAIMDVTGAAQAQPSGIAFDSNGALFVNDDASDSLLKVDPVSGAVQMCVTKGEFESTLGSPVDLGASSSKIQTFFIVKSLCCAT